MNRCFSVADNVFACVSTEPSPLTTPTGTNAVTGRRADLMCPVPNCPISDQLMSNSSN